MPSATIDSHGILGVAAAGTFLKELLARAESVKKTASIEPPLEKSDLGDLRQQLSDALGYEFTADEPVDTKKAQRFALIETAARDIFKSLVVSWSLGRASPAVLYTNPTPPPGNHTNRVPFLRQCLESPRHPLPPLGLRTLRSCVALLVG